MPTTYKVTDAELTSVANKIRNKGGTSAQLEWPTGFVSAIDAISGGGGSANLQAKTATANGIVLPDSGYDGLSQVTVAVPIESGGSYFGITDPESSLGSDGEYYYKYEEQSVGGIVSYSLLSGSATKTYGNEFTLSESVTINKLRGITTANRQGYLRIGTENEILAQTDEVTFTANKWSEASLDTPISLSANTTYIVQVVITSSGDGNIRYGYRIPTTRFGMSIVASRYNGYPGTRRANEYVCADIVIAGSIRVVNSQYHKENGSWVNIA